MTYISVTEAAARWGLSVAWVRRLCQTGRIPGAIRAGSYWIIPAATPPPAAKRRNNNDYRHQD